MGTQKTFQIAEVAQSMGIKITLIIQCIENQWVIPAEPKKSNKSTLDEEDIARIRLIHSLQEQFGVNDESIPIILNLLDQLYHLHHRIRQGR